MITYSENTEIKFFTGRTLDDYYNMSLSSSEIELLKDNVREKCYHFINSQIQTKTAVPSQFPQMKMIEINLCIYEILTDSFSGQETNASEYPEKYKEDAMQMLESLQFPASNTIPEGCNTNTGNGIITILNLKESYLKTETFFITAQNANKFSVEGSTSGYIGQATLAEIFPEHQASSLSSVFSDYGVSVGSYRSIPLSFIITLPEIEPVSFIAGDNFTFRTYAGKDIIKSTTGRITRG